MPTELRGFLTDGILVRPSIIEGNGRDQNLFKPGRRYKWSAGKTLAISLE
jgi:hypothetical protein